MNGRVDYLLSEEVIELTRGPAGYEALSEDERESLCFGIRRINLVAGGAFSVGAPQRLESAVTFVAKSEAVGMRSHIKATGGLGFNIVGGTDQQYISNDDSIYVSRIKENGAAALDGRLQEGDRILSVNGTDLKNMQHQVAVDLFRTAGDNVTLKVQHRLLPQNGPSSHRGDGEPGGIPLAVILVPGLAITVAAVWAFLRYRQRV